MAGIYIHIPFCKQACLYCNFHFSTNKKLIPQLVNAIAKEAFLRQDYLTETIETIYFGGGTPSILPTSDIVFLIDEIKKIFEVNSNTEITLEANPDDIDEANLVAWKKAGINRFSLGIQSFIDAELQWMNRSHNAKQAKHCIDLIKKYFTNYSIDLIFGSQLLSNEDWLVNIKTALSFNPPHLSCYALTIEEKTVLGNKVSKKVISNIDNEKQAQQFNILMKELAIAGFHHYEISNYAQPNFESKHNSSYWQSKHYLGLGPSAHSFNGSTRSWNIANNALYIQSIENNNLQIETEELTTTQQLNEYIMIALRTSGGINLNIIEERFGVTILLELKNKITAWLQANHIEQKNNFIQLTNLGKLYADGIAADLFF
ncbi:MAG: radical SAM family heme chaperone HemW [Bacteroidetes bacterium]|nr:radical SAM family heme chaperone HemW [Bacteroidota bacterium]